MNSQLFTLSLIEIFISIFFTVFVIFISYKILKAIFFKGQDLRGDNLAFTIFTSGIIISIGMILASILPSITNIIRLSATQNSSLDLKMIVGYSGLYLLIGFVFAIVINSAVFLLFSILTKGVDEFKEIKNNNISVSILVVAILISITLIAKDSIALLVSSFIPYPNVTNYL